ncbi:MAG: alpha/beta hydrolase [Actinomycetota bacterium]
MSGRAAIRGEQIAFSQEGSGDIDLVLIHGFQNDRTAWQPFVDRLDKSRFRVVAFDLVGCGESSTPAEWTRCTIDEYAADLVALCNQLELSAPIVVGHSLGGATALRSALNAPDRFGALVLVAPASTTGLDFLPEDQFDTLRNPTVAQQRALARAAFRHPPSDDQFEELMAVIARASPQHIEGAARSMRDFVCIGELDALVPPALLVCGDRDRHVPLRNLLATQQAIPRCGLQVYFDVGHVPFVETPDSFVVDVGRFFETAVAAH